MPGLSWFRGRFGRTFVPEDNSHAFKEVFSYQKARDVVLPDLAEYCKVSEPSPWTNDIYTQGRYAGRRDVFLYIQELCKLSDDQVRAFYISKSKEV